jgi:hypothetical protein
MIAFDNHMDMAESFGHILTFIIPNLSAYCRPSWPEQNLITNFLKAYSPKASVIQRENKKYHKTNKTLITVVQKFCIYNLLCARHFSMKLLQDINIKMV